MTSKANQSQGMLLFHLSARQSFAIGTLKVKEIVPYTQLTALPHSHPTVLGAASMRGTTIPVIDMAMAVGYRPDQPGGDAQLLHHHHGLPPHPGGLPGAGHRQDHRVQLA